MFLIKSLMLIKAVFISEKELFYFLIYSSSFAA